jgi:hypothetical protein
MQTHTISPAKWQSTFDSLSRIYDGASASVEILSSELGAQMEVEDQPLRGISYDSSGIEIHFAMRDGRHLVHRIPNPKQVQIEEGEGGLLAALQIESTDDPRQILRFRSPVASKLLPSAVE